MSDDEYVIVEDPKKPVEVTETKEPKKTYKDILLQGAVKKEKEDEYYCANDYGDYERYEEEDDSLEAMDRDTEEYENSRW